MKDKSELASTGFKVPLREFEVENCRFCGKTHKLEFIGIVAFRPAKYERVLLHKYPCTGLVIADTIERKASKSNVDKTI